MCTHAPIHHTHTPVYGCMGVWVYGSIGVCVYVYGDTPHIHTPIYITHTPLLQQYDDDDEAADGGQEHCMTEYIAYRHWTFNDDPV